MKKTRACISSWMKKTLKITQTSVCVWMVNTHGGALKFNGAITVCMLNLMSCMHTVLFMINFAIV